MGKEYIIALRESLEKKLRIMDETYSLCILQEEVLKEENADLKRFDQLVDEKDICIEKMTKLDEGFQLVYEKVREELTEHKEDYADEIAAMQKLISKITDVSASVMAIEERNRKRVSNVLAKERCGIKEGRRSVSVAMNYYKGMTGMGIPESRYMDKKK